MLSFAKWADFALPVVETSKFARLTFEGACVVAIGNIYTKQVTYQAT